MKFFINKFWIRSINTSNITTSFIYNKICIIILVFGFPAWNSALTKIERCDIERVQKVAIHIILGDKYDSYEKALELTSMETLEIRRNKLCLKFAKKAEKNVKHMNWFKKRPKTSTRLDNPKYWSVIARTERLKNSPIPCITDLLNKHYRCKK